MKTTLAIILSAIAAMTYGCAQGESYKRAGFDFSKLEKIAVIDVLGDVKGEAGRNQIYDFWSMELLKKGYAPVERSQIQSILNEQQFQASGATPEADAVRAGRILNVPVVMVINIPNFGEEMSMTAKMLNVEDGSILWLGSGTGGSHRWFTTIAGVAAGAAAGAAIGGDSGEQIAGGILGGVVGGVAGRALSPQEATAAQKLIKKISEDLPPRINPLR